MSTSTSTPEQLVLIIAKLDALTAKVNGLATDIGVLKASVTKTQDQGREIKQVVNDTQLAVINVQTAVGKIRF
jgi:type II secretory pathway component PulM